jgi:hypothetical protein
MTINFLQGVAREEGFYAQGTRPQRNLNPGDIEYGKFASAHGATGTDGRFAIFPTADAGFAAMRALFQAPGYKGLTVEAALNRWPPLLKIRQMLTLPTCVPGSDANRLTSSTDY